MVINYRRTQKTILRVSPRVPLADHLPAICEKCEFDVGSTVLLRDVHSLSPLDLSCSLNDYTIREVYARDTKSKSSTLNSQNPVRLLLIWYLLCRTAGLSCVSSFTKSCRYQRLETDISRPVPSDARDFATLSFLFLCAVFRSKDKTQKEEENKGLFSKFRKSRTKSEQVMQY